MATTSGQPGIDLRLPGIDLRLKEVADQLFREPYCFRFFQAVRLLERIELGRKPVGFFVSPRSEVVRFSAQPSLTFPPSELFGLARKDDGQLEMTVQFMGLNAAISVLPAPYTELLLERARAKDHAPREFFDIFNHRFISLFFRGWSKGRFYIAFERGDRDPITPRLMDLIGLGTPGLERRMEIPDAALLYYAGLLGKHARNSMGLKQLLEDYFEVPVEIEQFAGTWRRLPVADQSFLHGTTARNEQLGIGTILGEEVWDQHGRVRVRLGPLSLERYQQFLPGARSHRQLQAWFRFYANGAFDFEVQLVLRRDETPGCWLEALGDKSPRLGFMSWIKTKPIARDPDEATYVVS
jgi:type VI secretion system protein ImpH